MLEVLSNLKSISMVDTFGTYIAIKPTDTTLSNLAQWAKNAGIELDDDLHVTLLYSRREISPKLYDGKYVVRPKKIQSLGPASVVLTLDANCLIERHEEFISMGATHDFESYIPHLTLKFEGGDPTTIPPIDFFLTFAVEEAESLDDTRTDTRE